MVDSSPQPLPPIKSYWNIEKYIGSTCLDWLEWDKILRQSMNPQVYWNACMDNWFWWKNDWWWSSYRSAKEFICMDQIYRAYIVVECYHVFTVQIFLIFICLLNFIVCIHLTFVEMFECIFVSSFTVLVTTDMHE